MSLWILTTINTRLFRGLTVLKLQEISSNSKAINRTVHIELFCKLSTPKEKEIRHNNENILFPGVISVLFVIDLSKLDELADLKPYPEYQDS